MMRMDPNGRKHLKRLLLTIMILFLWAGFSNGSGTDVWIDIDVIGNGETYPPAGENLFYVEEIIDFTATPAEGWHFHRWIN